MIWQLRAGLPFLLCADATPRDRTTALASNTQFCSSAKKYCGKCCSFKKISYFCSLKANRKIVKMRCKTTHFLMLTPATAWVGIFTS